MDKKERISELVKILNEAGRVYEQEDREIMSNFEYDRLYDELLTLEKETGITLSNSPTIKVGYEVLSELPKEKHPSKMLSLNKTKSVEELAEFLGDKEGVLSWKMDGLTNVFTYKNGELQKAVTRGNGEIGEIITNNARVYKNLPLKIPYEGELVIRGEAIITYSEFERINSEIEDIDAKYKNPRNLCSGSVRQLNNEITAQRNVMLYAFALISTEPEIAFSTRVEQFEWLEKQGFCVVEYTKVNAFNINEKVKAFSEKVKKNDFPSDGLVLVLNDIAYAKTLGTTAKFPRDAIAFKWQDEIGVTKLLDIEWSASRTGLINPVAIFEPVELEGTTVSRASVHNVSILEALKLGKNDTIKVYKANMIIPQIAENVTGSGTFTPPEVCPVCGQKTRIKQDIDSRVLVCDNAECLAKKIKNFSLFVTRDAMNIDGVSEATIEKWINLGILKTLDDFYHLEKSRDVIINMEGFGIKSYENVIDAVNKSRKTESYRVLYSLGVPLVGVQTAKMIMKYFKDDLVLASKANAEELLTIDGIGGVIAYSFVEFFSKRENVELMNSILNEVEIIVAEDNGNGLEGLTFVITGSLNTFSNRDELKLLIEKNGGKVAGSVSKNTSYLINNDIMSNSSKNKTAKSLGVEIITEEDFLQKFGVK